MLLDAGLPCFDTVIYNHKQSFVSSINASSNAVILHLLEVTCFFVVKLFLLLGETGE